LDIEEDVQLSVAKEIDLRTMPRAALEETENEVRILKSLSHVNIVAYYDTVMEDGTMYILMEYADAGDLFSAVKCRRSECRHFEELEVLSILLQCARALRHIHARRIVHRDLKSQNIFLSNAGGGGCIVKIGDFGIAKVLQHTRGLAQTLIGTPSNLPPEVCDSKPYGTKADIWSLGVVFYELLTLEPPFKAMSLAALAIKIVNGEPKPILNDFYAEEVRGLVRPMLEKDPARRPSAARLLQKNPLRRVAQMPSLPMLMERPSSSSISEVETLTPASVGRASLGVLEVQTPRSQEGEPSVPATPGSTILLEPLGSPRHFVATPVSEAAGSLSAQTDLLTELDVLSQAMLPCRTGDIPKEDPGQRRQTTAKCRKATSVQGRGNSNTAARYRRSLSSGAGFGISAVQGESTWARPPCARSSSRKKLKPQRPRPTPLAEAASCEQFFQGQHLQLPALKPSSLPPTPRSDGTEGSRASSIGVLRCRPGPMGLPSPVQAPGSRSRRSPAADAAPRPPRDFVTVPSPSGERVDIRPSPHFSRRLASLSEEQTRSGPRTLSRRRGIQGLGSENTPADLKAGCSTEEVLGEEERLPRLLGRCGAPEALHSKASGEHRPGRAKPEILS